MQSSITRPFPRLTNAQNLVSAAQFIERCKPIGRITVLPKKSIFALWQMDFRARRRRWTSFLKTATRRRYVCASGYISGTRPLITTRPLRIRCFSKMRQCVSWKYQFPHIATRLWFRRFWVSIMAVDWRFSKITVSIGVLCALPVMELYCRVVKFKFTNVASWNSP